MKTVATTSAIRMRTAIPAHGIAAAASPIVVNAEIVFAAPRRRAAWGQTTTAMPIAAFGASTVPQTAASATQMIATPDTERETAGRRATPSTVAARTAQSTMTACTAMNSAIKESAGCLRIAQAKSIRRISATTFTGGGIASADGVNLPTREESRFCHARRLIRRQVSKNARNYDPGSR